MTTSSESLDNAENGHGRPRMKIFDAASEDDPLLLNQPLLLPNNMVLPDAVEQTPPPPPSSLPSSSPNFGLLTTPAKVECAQRKKQVVQYDSSNHFRVLFGWFGSVWPYVLPYCIVVVLFTYLVYYLQQHSIVDLTFASAVGHQFMGIMVSFLVVTRSNLTYSRFMEQRQYLSEIYRSCRELVQHVCILTLGEDSRKACEWRQQVAYRTILLLRITIAAIEV